MMYVIYSICIGFLLDFCFGDPYCIPHPIVFIGKAISGAERLLRRLFPSSHKGETAAGAVLAIFLPVISFCVSAAILYIAYKIHFLLWFALNTFWAFQIIAARCLATESKKVYNCLKKGDIEMARKQLSWLVGRDTTELSEKEITKACVETVAENTSDGVTAPLFYMIIGGVPLGMFYKTVNTLDSMVGYRNEKYEYFGKVSAKLDDILNFIPSRICGLLMAASAAFAGLNAKNAFRIFKRDRLNHLSPNSAQTESAVSGALGIELGGTHIYFGKVVEKPTIGDDIREPEPYDIIKTNKLMFITSLLSMILFAFIWIGIYLLILKMKGGV